MAMALSFRSKRTNAVKNPFSTRGFTLIELLIVVAIIAILAAIAVPNFLEAQTRAKVSRSKSDIRTLTTGLESYRVDNQAYPKGNPFNTSGRRESDPQTRQFEVLEKLSTPIAYVTSGVLPDPFRSRERSGVINLVNGAGNPVPYTAAEQEQEASMKYAALVSADQLGTGSNILALTANPADRANSYWILWSAGPDGEKTQVAGLGLLNPNATEAAILNNVYDPTNGTVSRGSVFRVGGQPVGEGAPGGRFFRVISGTQ